MVTQCKDDDCRIHCDCCVFMRKQPGDKEEGKSFCTKKKQFVSWWNIGCPDFFCVKAVTNDPMPREEKPVAKPKAGDLFQHFKGNTYVVVEMAMHSETQEELVIYTKGDGKTWARPLNMWNEEVYHEGNLVNRFKLIHRF